MGPLAAPDQVFDDIVTWELTIPNNLTLWFRGIARLRLDGRG